MTLAPMDSTLMDSAVSPPNLCLDGVEWRLSVKAPGTGPPPTIPPGPAIDPPPFPGPPVEEPPDVPPGTPPPRNPVPGYEERHEGVAE